MNFPTLLGFERQRSIDTIRRQPEFAAFEGLSACLDDDVFKSPALLPFYLRQALERHWPRRAQPRSFSRPKLKIL
jgi:hypothetical protein